MTRAALWIGLLASLGPGRADAATVAQTAFSKDPEGVLAVSERDKVLLTGGGYRLDERGRLYTAKGEPVVPDEFAFALEDARSRARLKALLEINLILNRNNYSKKLPAEDVAALRKVGSENWDLFSKSTRKDLRRFFTDTEFLIMNEKVAKSGVAVPPPYDLQKPWDPGAQASLGLGAAETEPVWSGVPLALVPEALLSLALTRPPEAAAMLAPKGPPAAPAPVVALPPPWTEEGSPPASAPPARKEFAAETPAPPPVAAVQGLDQSVATAKPAVWELKSPVLERPPLGVVATPPPLPAITTVPGQESASYPEFNAASFKSFLDAAPYGRDVKALLQLIADAGRDPERRVALGLVQLQFPHLVLDSRKSGSRSARSERIPEQGRPEGRLGLALNDGSVIVKVRHLFSKQVFLIPDSPDFYRERALPVPALQAMSREASSESDRADDAGTLRVYHDGSTRLRSSPEQLAGGLLKELILLDSKLRGWDGDAYHAELRAEAAQFQFYRDVAAKTGKEPGLDADMAARLKAWIERPEEHVDMVLQTMSAPRGGLFEPKGVVATARQEIADLVDAGAVDAGAARRTLDSLPPEPGEEGLVEAWLKSASSSPAQAAWLDAEKQARRTP